MEESNQGVDYIERGIRNQLELNRARNLFFAHYEQIEQDPSFLNALRMLLEQDDQALAQATEAAMVDYACDALLQRVYAINQFLSVDAAKRDELARIYRGTWKLLAEGGEIRSVLEEHHYPELARWLSGLYPKDFVERMRWRPDLTGVVCEEYSPQLQLSLYGLDLNRVMEPVLDVGCGAQARLARGLRTLHIEAYGIDRQLEARAEYLRQVDWLAFEFQPERWGTVLSNMAFSNHLIYALRHDAALFERLREKYFEILNSLRVGGKFYYAPGVEPLERELDPRRYALERRLATRGLYVCVATRLSKTEKEDL